MTSDHRNVSNSFFNFYSGFYYTRWNQFSWKKQLSDVLFNMTNKNHHQLLNFCLKMWFIPFKVLSLLGPSSSPSMIDWILSKNKKKHSFISTRSGVLRCTWNLAPPCIHNYKMSQDSKIPLMRRTLDKIVRTSTGEKPNSVV